MALQVYASSQDSTWQDILLAQVSIDKSVLTGNLDTSNGQKQSSNQNSNPSDLNSSASLGDTLFELNPSSILSNALLAVTDFFDWLSIFEGNYSSSISST